MSAASMAAGATAFHNSNIFPL